jgi:hypothetical protein
VGSIWFDGLGPTGRIININPSCVNPPSSKIFNKIFSRPAINPVAGIGVVDETALNKSQFVPDSQNLGPA